MCKITVAYISRVCYYTVNGETKYFEPKCTKDSPNINCSLFPRKWNTCMIFYSTNLADPEGHAVYGVDLQPLDCWAGIVVSNPADVMNVRPFCVCCVLCT